MAVKLLERKKKFVDNKEKLLERKKKFKEEATDTKPGIFRSKRGTREDYEKDSYRWCSTKGTTPKIVKVVVVMEAGKFVKKKVTVDGEVTFEA